MSANLTLNVLYDAYVNIEAADASLYPYLDKVALPAIQVTTAARAEQGHTFALRLKNRYPKMTVVFRLSNDDFVHQRLTTPQAWYDSYAPWAADGLLMLSVNNEPGAGDLPAQDAWMAGIAQKLHASGLSAVFWNFQTHNTYAPAQLDQTLHMLAQYREMRIGFHYYWDNEHGAPVDAVHTLADAYCTQKGIAAPVKYITEHGYLERLQPTAGYHGRLSSETYAQQITAAAAQYPELTFFVYGWGASPPWQDLDVSGDSTVQSAMVRHNQEQPVPTPIVPVGSPQNGAATVSLNVRATPTTSASRIGGLTAGQKTVYYPDDVKHADGYPWVVVTLANGTLGWAALADKDGTPWIVPELLPDAWTVKLDVPYVSQTDLNAALSLNDCLVASLAMLTRWWFKRVNGIVPDLPTVDEMTRHTALAQPNPPKGLTFQQGIELAAHYGLAAKYLQPVTADMLMSYLDAQIPVAVLLDYSKYAPGQAPIAHILVVRGYSPTMFLTHDPYLRGANVALSKQQLLDAMSSSPGNSLGYQGMVLTS